MLSGKRGRSDPLITAQSGDGGGLVVALVAGLRSD
jgi:hypothetical protein